MEENNEQTEICQLVVSWLGGGDGQTGEKLELAPR